jgi:hypothetical protein
MAAQSAAGIAAMIEYARQILHFSNDGVCVEDHWRPWTFGCGDGILPRIRQ